MLDARNIPTLREAHTPSGGRGCCVKVWGPIAGEGSICREWLGEFMRGRIQEAFLEEALTTAWAEQECSGWGRG